LLTQGSEEGDVAGLGLVDGYVRYFDPAAMKEKLPVPHMGWAHVTLDKKCPLLSNLDPMSRFYFVHSLHVSLDKIGEAEAGAISDKTRIIATTDYGYPFVSGVSNGNVFGVQFHPEKSHMFGSQLLKNYSEVL
jgi:glutamine amidotransferase